MKWNHSIVLLCSILISGCSWFYSENEEFKKFDKEVEFDYVALQKTLEYPEEAIKAGIEGTVVIKVRIDENGKPDKILVLASDSKVLNEAAIRAVKYFSGYKPAIMDGKPVAQSISIPFKFKLR